MNIDSTKLLANTVVKGDIIPLRVTDEKHHNGISFDGAYESPSESFAAVFNRALQNINDEQVNSEALKQQLVSEPGSVEAHTVAIAAEKARLSLTFAKTISDLAVKTYRELTNLR